jgi:predicted PurR-regulated permease PerM
MPEKHQRPQVSEDDPHLLKDYHDPNAYPTLWQRKVMWGALSGFAVFVIGALFVVALWLLVQALAYLQPLLLPFAVAAVLAYLLYPLVRMLGKSGMPERKAGTFVFVGFLVVSALLFVAIVMPLSRQIGRLTQDYESIAENFEGVVDRNFSPEKIDEYRRNLLEHETFGGFFKMIPIIGTTDEEEKTPEEEEAEDQQMTELQLVPGYGTYLGTKEQIGKTEKISAETEQDLRQIGSWIAEQLPEVGKNILELLRRSIGGFLGAFGFILGFVLTPIYLFFFLRESSGIKENWANYLPLKASPFKKEVVDLLQEINGYLIAFFRGQLVVSMADGLLTAIIFTILDVKFGLLIGVMVATIGIIPYLGVIICYIPAIIIATVQGAQGGWYLAPDAPWYVLPIVVTVAWVAIQNIDGYFLAPKIVGDAVGLHPLTVIVSVFFWGTVLGGLLGAILAVPLTATLKVLFRRYIWEKQKPPESQLHLPLGDEHGEKDKEEPSSAVEKDEEERRE